MNQIFRNSLLFASLAFLPAGARGDDSKVLYADLVQPILNAKCVACHGPDKQKGKLRLDSLEAILGGSDGENVIPGKVDDSLMTFRVTLPKDDGDIMPPEDEPQLSKEEIEVLKFWVASGAKGDAKIGDLKPAGEAANAIKVVLANPPKAPEGVGSTAEKKEIDPAKQKLAEETIGRVEKEGASLMAIAQDTPDLRFSALNVAKDYGDKNLELLKPVADQVKWMDLARTQVTDAGLAHVAGMKNLTRLHLENTKVSDAGLEHLKALPNLEYLNLYGTQVTDAGIQKLAGLKNLKKLFVWQTKVTDGGAQKLASAIPGIDVNTGWKEPAAKPVELAANTTKPAGAAAAAPAAKPAPAPAPAPVKKEEPAKPADKKPEPAKPAEKKPEPAKPAEKKPEPAKTAEKKPEPAKPAPAPAKKEEPASFADLGDAISKALTEAKAAAAQAQSVASSAKSASDNAGKVAAEAQKVAGEAKSASAAAKTASDEAKKVSGEAKSTSDAAKKASDEAKSTSTAAKSAADGAVKTAGEANSAASNAVKVANEAKAAADGAQKTAAQAQQAAAAAQKAAADAQKAAAEANRVASEAKSLLMELQKAAAAIVGAVE